MRKIHKDDEVIVIAGKDKGRQGKVINVIGQKAVVEGVNAARRHTKPNPNNNDPGGIIVKYCRLLYPMWQFGILMLRKRIG